MESSKTELPPLPERFSNMSGTTEDAYSADQMREYALAAIREAVAAQRERDAKLVESTPAEAFCTPMHQGQLLRARETFAAAIRGATSPEGK